MGLRNLVIPTELVKVSDGEGFTVRGLSPYDVLSVYSRHAGDLSALFDRFKQTAKISSDGENDIAKIAAGLVKGTPHIMAEIIALASDSDPDGVELESDVAIARKLSLGIQSDALERIGRLTFTSDMPPKKFFGLVLAMLGSATAVLQKPKV